MFCNLFNSLLVHGFCLTSSCCLLILPVMVFPVFFSPGLSLLSPADFFCRHPNHTNITGHSLSEALHTAEAEHGVSSSRRSLPIPLLPVWCFPACPSGFVAQIPSTSLSSAKISSTLGLLVVSHLSCYFGFLAVELLACAALSVSGMLFRGDST